MKKWFDEEYEFTVEVVGFLRGDHTERYCRNGEEIGDKYTCTYGCPWISSVGFKNDGWWRMISLPAAIFYLK